jgi:hypothetical protein
MATEIQAPNAVPADTYRIFLAGTIDMGSSRDWQSIVVKALADYDVVLTNPRREDWDSSWEQTKDDPQFREQVEWEQDQLDAADYRIFNFEKDSKSPITFEELGHHIDAPGAVACPQGFYRKGNVDIVCERAGMPVYETLEELIDHLKAILDEKGLRKGSAKEAAITDTKLEINTLESENSKEPNAAILQVTETPTFQAWFVGSKVVDAQGNPLVQYHGTPRKFTKDEFQIGAGGQGSRESLGFHFGPSEAANNRLEKGMQKYDAHHFNWQIMPVYLSIKNPLKLPDVGDWENLKRVGRWLVKSGISEEQVQQALSKSNHTARIRAIIKVIQTSGYDGIVYHNEHEGGGDSWIALDPRQIKSAIGNKGEFDPNSKSITATLVVEEPHAEAPAAPTPITDTSAFKIWFRNSIIKDDTGNPLVVYRGEHGDSHEEFQSREPSLSFGGKETASIYAMSPNHRDDTPVNPRVYPCYLRIENPVLNNQDDPFWDFSDVEDKVGRDKAIHYAIKHEGFVTNTNNWDELFSNEYGSVEDLLKERPDAIRELYMLAFPLLADPEFVSDVKGKGYDGAIHLGYGDGGDEMEYKVFDRNQVKSAIGNNGEFDPKSKSTTASSSIQLRLKTEGNVFRIEAYHDLMLVGQLSAKLDGSTLQITFVDVNLKYRKQGIATGMYRELFEQAEKAGFTDVYSDHALKPGGKAIWKKLQKEDPTVTHEKYEDEIETGKRYRKTLKSAAAPTESTSFKRWFGGSKMVDANGEPKTFFHGTFYKFDTFAASERGSFGSGMYFAPNEDTAQMFADGGHVVPVYLKLLNPMQVAAVPEPGYDLDFDCYAVPFIREIFGVKASRVLKRSMENDGLFGIDVTKKVKSLGHDGLIVTYPDGSQEIVAYEPNQIKSAYANDGEFSTTNHRFTASISTKCAACESGDCFSHLATGPRKQARFLTVTEAREAGKKYMASPEFKAAVEEVAPGKSFSQLTGDELDRFNFVTRRKDASVKTAKPIAYDAKQDFVTEAPKFKTWFKGSQIVDDHGRPMIMFHGTTKAFDKFEAEMKKRAPASGLGFYFTSDPDLASKFTQHRWTKENGKLRPGANIMPVYLRITNPKYLDPWEWMQHVSSDERVTSLRQQLQSQGYDGVIVKALENDFTGELQVPQVIAFRATQIKSAIGNNGDFDTESHSVTGSKLLQPKEAAKKDWLGLALAPFMMAQPGNMQPSQQPTTPTHSNPTSFSQTIDQLPKGYKSDDVVDRRFGEKPSLSEKVRDISLSVKHDYQESFDKNKDATPEQMEQELSQGLTQPQKTSAISATADAGIKSDPTFLAWLNGDVATYEASTPVYNADVSNTSHQARAKLLRHVSASSDLEKTMHRATRVLSEAGIPSLVVGGYAVQEHGYARYTYDVDIVVPDVREARERLGISGFRENPGSSMTVTDRNTKVEVDLLPGGGAVGPGPLQLPLPTDTSAGPHIADLPTLIAIKLSSYLGSGIQRAKDLSDVVELIKVNSTPRDLRLPDPVEPLYVDIWDEIHKATPDPKRASRIGLPGLSRIAQPA